MRGSAWKVGHQGSVETGSSGPEISNARRLLKGR